MNHTITPELIIHYGQVQAENDSLRAELAELRARVPAICFPRQPNGEGGWVIDANYVAAIHKDCFPIEWQPCEEEVEAVLLAVERAAPVTPAAVPDDVAKDADPEYAWSLCGEEYHDRLDTREAAIAELDGSGGFTGRVVDAYDACGECDIAEVIVDQVESWLSDSVPSDDFIIDVTEEQKDALNSIVWEWFYKNVSPNRWTVTDVQEHSADDVAARRQESE